MLGKILNKENVVMITLSKSQIETIVLEAIQAGATAMAEQLDVENVSKNVCSLMKVDGENLISSIAASSMRRYGQNK